MVAYGCMEALRSVDDSHPYVKPYAPRAPYIPNTELRKPKEYLMYVCYFSMTDTLGKRISGYVKVKLPVIPRIGDYVNVRKVNVDADTVAGVVKEVDMYCGIEQEIVEFGVDTVPEPQDLTWYITLEQNESKIQPF